MVEARLLGTPNYSLDDPGGWLATLGARYGADEQRTIERAVAIAHAELGERLLPNGESALEHALGTATILAGMAMDHESVAAALLLDVEVRSARARERMREKVGPQVLELVEGAARMAQIESLGVAVPPRAHADAHLEGLRKMLLAMVQDFRVVLIKLAAHTQTLRALVKSDDESQRQAAARLSLDIFAPLANRVGVWQLKWELEDLAFRIVEPELYKRIARLLDEKRVERERFIADAREKLSHELALAGIHCEITGRPKHIYSIYKKMQRKGLAFEDVHDINALRVFVNDVKDCYAVLGIVHTLWTPLPREFDDYIAKPKANDYRSLHTAVIGPGERVLEVQIRTYEMHQQAELGIAAHWRYKEGSRTDSGYDQKLAWLRQMLEWKEELADGRSLADHFRTGLFDDTVYVLTPQGKVIDLPKGATPVDFAYTVHTDLGHRCRGARVDGAMVPLNTQLAHGQTVEIIAARQGGPSRDWLNPTLGYIASHRARVKVRQWFNAQNLETAIAQGRAVVDKELQRLGLTALKLETVAERAGFATLPEFLAAVGRGEVNARQLQAAMREPQPASAEPSVPELITHKPRPATGGSGILVVGVDKLLTAPARCCKPAPPDPIVGFVTRGRGVTIHRAGCINLRSMPAERLIAAQWGDSDGGAFPVDIEIEAADRTGLLRDVSDTLARERINVLAANTGSRDTSARMGFTIEVSDIAQLARVLGLLAQVPGVMSARRR